MMNQFPHLTKREAISGWCYLLFQAILLPLILALINSLLITPMKDAHMNFIYFCINFICVTVIFRRYLYTEIKKLSAAPWQVLRYALWGFLIYYAATIGIGLLIQYVYPAFSNANDSSVTELVREDFTLTAIGTILLVPPAEELLYRALLFGSIRKYSRTGAYAASIVIFSSVHIVGYIGIADPISLLLSFLQYAPAAFCLCWAYERSGSIFAPMLMHIAINQIGISVMR